MTPSLSGIYIARPIEDRLVPVTRDPRYVAICARVNNANVKVGKARNLSLRERSYHKDFDPENIWFMPIVLTDEIQRAETAILRELRDFRKRSPKGRRMDWLEGISVEETISAIFRVLHREGLPYESLLEEPR